MTQNLGAEWVFPITSPPLYRHTVVVEGGIIQEIRPVRDSDTFYPNHCLMPGLINAHTHLAYTAFRNLFDDYAFFPWIRKLTESKLKLTEEEIVASTHLGILENIQAGITCVADMCDLEPALRALSQSPLRGTFYWEVFGVEKEQAKKSWSFLESSFPKLKQQYESERLDVGISPHSCYTVRPELFEQIGNWARQHNVPISFHIAESREEEEFISRRTGIIASFLKERASDWSFSGSTSIGHLEKTGIFQTRPLLAHAVQANSEDIKILRKHDVSLAHCPKSNAKFAHGIAPLYAFMDAGLRVGLGTDSAASNNRFDLFEEARFALLQQRSAAHSPVLSEEQMLRLMTIESARSMNLERRVGSLECGKEADLILVETPPYYTAPEQITRHLVHNATAQDVRSTWIHGEEIQLEPLREEIKAIYKRVSSF